MAGATISPIEDQASPGAVTSTTSQFQQAQEMISSLKIFEDMLTTEGDEVSSDFDNNQDVLPQGK